MDGSYTRRLHYGMQAAATHKGVCMATDRDMKTENPWAFPSPEYIPLGGKPQYELGMTLRDYFAGVWLSSFRLNSTVGDCPTMSDVAERCYKMADAMLAERAK